MDRSDAKSVIVLSDSYFYKKIIKKYQTDKIRDLNFSRMIFCKNVRYPFPQTINVNVHLQLHLKTVCHFFCNITNFKKLSTRKLDFSSPVSCTVYKNLASDLQQIQDTAIKPLLLTLNHVFNSQTNNIIPSSNVIINPQMSNQENNTKLLKSQMFRGGLSYGLLNPVMHLASDLQQIRDTAIKPLLLTLNHVFNSQTNNIIPSSNVIINPQMSNQGNNTKLLKSQMFRGGLSYGLLNPVMQTIYLDKNTHKNQYRQPSILSQYNLFFNSTMDSIDKPFFKNPNQATVNQHLLKNYYGSFKNIKSGFVHRAYSYKTDYENLHFQDSRRLESEIELIKKIVIQTQESVLEKIPPALGEAEIKRHIDINRISDQVYQNLERKIRIERERRGV